MYLKSIEIQGFKSFPDKTLLQFSSGISAIVGPNGSGKSNIVDAIRWVLGEQSSKTLRGGKMEDVIFGGTARRKPQGYCEVSLTLDNAERAIDLEYAEVTITRRYYRSGESEFFINRKSVRLRDIHELFMDTGLGRDGYSIIGQGRIDEILSVKSADRREIFEEAAGITKFRYRKEESERKLAAAEENLMRVRDIITELEGQVAPLGAQAERAKRYLIFRDELRVLEVSLWMEQLDKLKDGLQKVQVDYDNAERMLSARRGELETLYARSEALSDEMRQKELEGERLRDELRQIENRQAELRGQIAVNQTNLQNNQENIALKLRELEDQGGREATLTAQKAAREQRLAELAQQERELLDELDELLARIRRAEGDSGDLTGQLDALDAEQREEERAAGQVSSEKNALLSAQRELETRAGAIGRDLQELGQRMEQERLRAEGLSERVSQSQSAKTAAENMLRGFALRLESREKKAGGLSAQVEQLKRERGAAEDRLGMLRAMEREYEGYSQSVRRVMAEVERGGLRGVHGPVSRLIHTDDRYSVAIEIALGAAMQNIVVDTEQDAKAAIGYLKRHEYGRATFLPLSAVRQRSRGERDLTREPGFCGYADKLLRYEAAYDGLVKSLLGGTAVVEHIDSAIALAKKYGYGFRIVTLDGQLLSPSGAMTGGSLNKNVGILSRANEIERMAAKLAALEERAAEEERSLAEARRELASAKYEHQMAQDELRQAEDNLLRYSAEQKQHGALLDSLTERKSGLESERQEQAARRAQAQAQLQELERREAGHLAKAQELAARRSGLAQGLAELENRQSAFTQALSQTRSGLASNQTERDTLRAGIGELEQLIASMAGDRAGKLEMVEALRQRNGELKQALEQLERQLEQTGTLAGQKGELVRAANEERLRLEGLRAKCDRESQNKNSELVNLERERSRLENKKTQTEMEERQILDKLWESYELTRTTALEVRQELDSLSQAGRRVGELRGEIKKLGPVNLGAIDEYAKVNERYQFLSAQKDDLERAKGDLLAVIGELTSNMQRIFAEQFERIDQTFRQTFVEIFGGGSASLRLEDQGDILNCGIEIKVELPGKSTRVISLLSGGEKAFVAIALYFAIIKVRPTPFCVMDEIEAALDDVNVLRYIGYMRTLCDRTQFIVITHRRGTMEGSDILYGVTMQEQGVSKLLALNINEVEEKIKLKPV